MILVASAWLAIAAPSLAASPSPSAGSGDPRSSGQGPGLVGDPVFALVAVLAIGLGAAIVTFAYIRVSSRR